jgi:hypothetical protein
MTLRLKAAALTQAPLADLGLSRLTARRIQRLAQAVVRGHLRFDPTVAFDAMVRGRIREADIDQAAAHWVAMRTLAEPDASPFGAPSIPAAAQPWLDPAAQETLRPWCSYAAVLLALRSDERLYGMHRSPMASETSAMVELSEGETHLEPCEAGF